MQGLPKAGDVLGGTYRIESLLGKGGFGAVYLARQLSMDREVALKVLVAHAAKVEEMTERFRREVMAVRNLSHPNTIRIYDFHDGGDGLLYYSMEHVRGPTLKEAIEAQGRMSPKRVRHILRQVLKSLSEAHAYGIVHRDLKPANIMLADLHGETDFVKVLDFGIAKIVGGGDDEGAEGEAKDELTNAGVLVGTLRYMAPEQISGEGVGPHSDLYALALIGVEMLTGKSVFAGTGRWEVLKRQISAERVHIPTAVRECGLGAVFERALVKPTAGRFQSADDFLAALDAVVGLADSPLPEPTGPSSRASGEWSGKQPILAQQSGKFHQLAPSEKSQTTSSLSQPGARLPALIIGGIIVLSMVGAGTYLALSGPDVSGEPIELGEDLAQQAGGGEVAAAAEAPREEPTAELVEEDFAEPESKEPELKEMVSIHLTTPGVIARVLHEGELLGHTPMRLELDEAITVTLAAEGREDEQVELGPDVAPELSVAMAKLLPEEPPKPVARRETAPRKTARKTARKTPRPATTKAEKTEKAEKTPKKSAGDGWIDIGGGDSPKKDPEVPLF